MEETLTRWRAAISGCAPSPASRAATTRWRRSIEYGRMGHLLAMPAPSMTPEQLPKSETQ
ncbi:hypothetical protein ElP_13190 [Tautonia plasticadhaerens]|uniref:Uncharacterized protein n=1 Tax=Tautonia plasticadhaerens TaxID=2527974 RepID=A0A518GXY4_9BACT|nr:hypothetical protein ElP_13190 [Tautonia plasticadhaerens]